MNTHKLKRISIIALGAALAFAGTATASAADVQAELRSSAALLPVPAAGQAVPTAPAGAFASLSAGTGSLGAPVAATWTKFAP